MGSPASEPKRFPTEGPQHMVTFARPFAVQQFALTFEEWDACAVEHGCNGYKPSDQGWGRGRQPVINVSWNDAQAYVAWLSKKTGKSYRLLTEPEYEYATRAGMQTAYPWGNDIGEGNANCDGCGSRWDFKQTWLVRRQCIRSLRDGGRRLGVDRGLLARRLYRCACGRLGMEDGQLHVTCGPRRFLGRPFGERPLGQAQLGPLRRPEQQLGLPGWADALAPLNLYFLGRGVVFVGQSPGPGA